jgi:hypothetical protein
MAGEYLRLYGHLVEKGTLPPGTPTPVAVS